MAQLSHRSMLGGLRQLLLGGDEEGESTPPEEGFNTPHGCSQRPLFLPPELPLTPAHGPSSPSGCAPPALALFRAERPARPNFTGRWLLARVEGDYDQLLRDLGSSWCERRRVRSKKLGIGNWVQQIRQDGDEITIESCEGTRFLAMSLHIGRAADAGSRTAGLDRKEVSVTAYWDDATLQTKVQRLDWPSPLLFSRFFEQNYLVVKCMTFGGKVIRRYFTKQPDPMQVGHLSLSMVGLAGRATTPQPPIFSLVEPLAAASAAGPATSASAPFAGKWVLEHIEGDFEAFLVDTGVGEPVRRLSKSMNHGIGNSTQIIRQDGDTFAIVTEAGCKATTMEFRVGAGDQEVTGPDGSRIIVTPRWRNGALLMNLKKLDGTRLPPANRYIVDGHLVVDSATSKGERVMRYFNRASQLAVESFGSSGASTANKAFYGATSTATPSTATLISGSEASSLSRDSSGDSSGAGAEVASSMMASSTDVAQMISAGSTVDSHPAATAQDAVTRPNFTGKWMTESIEGDAEALLIDAGANWVTRKLAKSLKYGVGRFVQDIRQEGDQMEVVMTGGPVTTANRFMVGAGEQAMKGPDGREILGTPEWQGATLHLTNKASNGTFMPSVDRSMLGDRMVLDMMSSSGQRVRRFLVRQ